MMEPQRQLRRQRSRTPQRHQSERVLSARLVQPPSRSRVVQFADTSTTVVFVEREVCLGGCFRGFNRHHVRDMYSLSLRFLFLQKSSESLKDSSLNPVKGLRRQTSLPPPRQLKQQQEQRESLKDSSVNPVKPLRRQTSLPPTRQQQPQPQQRVMGRTNRKRQVRRMLSEDPHTPIMGLRRRSSIT
jgi:hypothetical protein